MSKVLQFGDDTYVLVDEVSAFYRYFVPGNMVGEKVANTVVQLKSGKTIDVPGDYTKSLLDALKEVVWRR